MVIASFLVALMKNIAASGGAYGFVKAAAANLREKDDSWNPAIGGFFSGGVLGLRCQAAPLCQWRNVLIQSQ